MYAHEAGTATPRTRRERLREATLTEIKETARHHLAEHGPNGVSLRAVARDMGMTAPGLYRYFSSLDDLMTALRADFFTELSQTVTRAEEGVDRDDVDGRILASLRAFRSWAVTHRAEFALLFASSAPEHPVPHDSAALESGRRFAATFLTLFDRLLEERRFPLPAEEDLPPALVRQLVAFGEQTRFTTPNASIGALRVLTSCWVRLYGLVCMEVFQHLAFSMEAMEPMFEAELRDILTDLGVQYRPPTH
ncbi:transcriptional regulator, TetR family [Marinactinospora thermotolerans DSM 45154]|uniref:Transcriptional regulator, TetR family n=1 Tax=Marinactinospora thermotolerans DSM 45154 TaxID=1122192 RepID=A0A1T4S6Q6_9ACTN|nr:TetR/AcrR family transcriptional regulator [Marinactinospora thermotolerans]SKA23929.1 transcriptional regulator, TetR family [Marinactinospora thermotolerans DSM 45154]